MQYEQPLIEGVLVRRYKRFLADVRLENGDVVTVHSSNTGSMKGCSEPGSIVWLSESGKSSRKTKYSWELVETADNVLVGVNTLLANKLVLEAIESNTVGEIQGYASVRTEVHYGRESSRIDLLLERFDGERCYVEVKNVTLAQNGVALFPDAVTRRGVKHLRELMAMVEEGHRAVVFFCVQRSDVSSFRAAAEIDVDYARMLRTAHEFGVEVLAYRAEVSPQSVNLAQPLVIDWDSRVDAEVELTRMA